MRKLFLFFSLLPIFSFVILFKGGSSVTAQDNLCSYCPDLRPQCSGQSGNQVGGEFFQCKPGGIDPATGRGTFTICKNPSCVNYEKFQYDGQSIYHVEEAIWAGGGGDNICQATGNKTFIRRFAAGGTAMKWVDRSLGSGACTTQQGYIKAYDAVTGAECSNTSPDKPPSSANNTLCNTYQGCIQFPNGVWTENGSILTVGSGAGAGENFYFDKNKGWIGFDRGNGGGNYVETPIGQGSPPADCKIVSGSATPPPPVSVGPQCNAQDGGDGDSRPVPCENCNQTNLRISSCATSFNANTSVSYRTNEGAPFCDGEAWVTKEWDGTVVVDASQAKIPFVGKEDNEDRQKYLADYFEGTCPYYNKNCVEGGRLTKNVGPWQMLASAYVQDDYKTKMIERGKSVGNAKEGGIHNYTVTSTFGGLFQTKLSELIAPPKLSDSDYKNKYQNWLSLDKGGKIWSYVPMFTREDTPGKIIPYLGSKIFDRFTITDPEKQIEKVPHVARLYEVTKAVQNVFFPQGLSLLAGKTAPTVAKAQTGNEAVASTPVKNDEPKTSYSPSIKSLIQNGIAWIKGLFGSNASAQGDTSSNSCYSISIETEVEPRDDGSFVFVTAKIHSIGGVGGHLRFYVNGVGTIVNSGWDAGSSDTYVVIPRWTMSPYFVPTGGSLPPINFSASTDQCPGNQLVSQACSFSLSADNKLLTNCGKPAVNNPPPSCDLPPAKSVNECQMGARKDTNPNDGLCCNPINIDLFAVDKFVNQDYTNIPGEIETRTQGVSRAIGVALVHPYLAQIWQQTNDPTTGIFNIFKPQDSERFNDEPAASNIAYRFTRGILGFGGGSASPEGGNFYFPMLGGIQSAKEWVSEKLLLPQR